ncbi:cytochrome-c peroxidase [Thalassotalea euphylliae]|uniref:Cytochrome-c peroxidase n=1 Tax=Thalassotalea euphylliae TaxID=1655234 RepID=A0A3E0UBQ2_9GAMM|nr:cytochrome-c peroxidase [Thalassotalea euphylliae]
MVKRYYQSLIVGIALAISIPFSYFVFLTISYDKSETLLNKTQYDFVNVDHAIQPLPTNYIVDQQWASLGKALFNSPLLSKDNTISCASCHMLDFGGDDGFSVSTGVGSQSGSRNSPTVLNAVFNFKQFWDGRANSLAQQIDGPIHNPIEMATSWPEVINKLSQDSYFSTAFKTLGVSHIESEHIVQALTIFEQSLITPNAPIDRYLLGDESALTPQQLRGLDKFTQFGCSACHQGRNIGGNLFQKLGQVGDIPAELAADKGKFHLTSDPLDLYVFKVPSLRNVALTAPYFHNGAVKTLPEAIQIMAKTQLGRELSSEDINDLVALLESFTAPMSH